MLFWDDESEFDKELSTAYIDESPSIDQPSSLYDANTMKLLSPSERRQEVPSSTRNVGTPNSR